MKLKDLSIFEFDEYAKNHPLGSYHQTSNYALLASEEGYDYDLVGMVDDNNDIVAASLIIYKKINFFNRYGYAPKGFLVDYYNPTIIKEFTKLLKKRYYNKNFSFIKINPEISIGTIDFKQETVKYNENKMIEATLIGLGFKKLRDNKLFEAKFPKFNVILPLKTATISSFDKRTRNKIRKSMRNGLDFVKGDRESIDIVFNFIKNKKKKTINHYYNYFNAFSKNDSMDIFLVKMSFEESLIRAREAYEEEAYINSEIVDKLMQDPSQENLKAKMESDKNLESIRNNIADITRRLTDKKEEYIAGAITIRYKNRVSILISGFNQQYKSYNPNYFLHYNLINYYKDNFDFLDLNGITGDFSDTNPYKGLNEFKRGFNPIGSEYIGEFDFIVNEGLYQNLENSGALAKEFQRVGKKTTK